MVPISDQISWISPAGQTASIIENGAKPISFCRLWEETGFGQDLMTPEGIYGQLVSSASQTWEVAAKTDRVKVALRGPEVDNEQIELHESVVISGDILVAAEKREYASGAGNSADQAEDPHLIIQDQPTVKATGNLPNCSDGTLAAGWDLPDLVHRNRAQVTVDPATRLESGSTSAGHRAASPPAPEIRPLEEISPSRVDVEERRSSPEHQSDKNRDAHVVFPQVDIIRPATGKKQVVETPVTEVTAQVSPRSQDAAQVPSANRLAPDPTKLSGIRPVGSVALPLSLGGEGQRFEFSLSEQNAARSSAPINAPQGIPATRSEASTSGEQVRPSQPIIQNKATRRLDGSSPEWANAVEKKPGTPRVPDQPTAPVASANPATSAVTGAHREPLQVSGGRIDPTDEPVDFAPPRPGHDKAKTVPPPGTWIPPKEAVVWPAGPQSTETISIFPETESADPIVTHAPATETIRHSTSPPPVSAPSLHPSVATRLVDVIERVREGVVEISLEPKELGRLKMSLLPGDGGLNVVILAERPETSDLLRRHIEQLGHQLREIGYRDVQFSFSGGNRGQNSDPAPGSSQQVSSMPVDQPGNSAVQNSIIPSLARSAFLDLRL